MWVVRFVPFTGLVHETFAEIRDRFVDETLLCLKRRSRGTFVNTRVLKRHHSSLEWRALRLVYGVWCMVDGAWCMVHGVWCMVYGVW